MSSLRSRLLVLAALTITGCTHSRPFDATSPDSRAGVNTRAESESALVTLDGGEQVRARGLHIAPDATTWIDPSTGEMRSVPTSELASVRFTDRGRGVLEGLGLGAVYGAGLGVVVGAVGGANDDGEIIQFSPVGGALVGSVLFGAAGAVIGGLAGLDQGSRTVYGTPAVPRDD
ncbi:MAG: hypothetical protein ABJF88_16700 [Rhodothermales bacterium]